MLASLLFLGGSGCEQSNTPNHSGQTATASRRTIRSQIQATGVVRAKVGAEVKVGARISGKVEELFANIGDQVSRGDPIAQLEDADLRARVARAEAELSAARAQLALLRRGARHEEIAEAEAVMARAEAEHALAASEAKRLAKLFSRGLIAQDEHETALRNLAVATSAVAVAKNRLALMRERYLPEEIALAEARARLAEAGLQEARAHLAYATITAPISGSIAQVTTQQGETVAAGMNAPTFVTIIDLSRLEVAAYVDEIDIGRVHVGQRASFTVDSFPDKDFAGHVSAIYPRAIIQSNVVNYICTIEFDEPYADLRPDMTATVSIVLDEHGEVLSIPARALRREGGRPVVHVVGDRGLTSKPVRVGRRGGGHVEIISGLSEGELVLVNQ